MVVYVWFLSHNEIMKASTPPGAFERFVQEQSLEDKRLVVCVSGGVDSMVLLACALLVHPREQMHVFHLDHATHPGSSAIADFVRDYCHRRGVQVTCRRLDSPARKDKENTWRMERKNRADVLARDIQAARVLTAHHATDLVETVLFRLCKGGGFSALTPFDISTKPFWRLAKEVLVEWAREQGIPWREDPSNADVKANARNRIRQEALPALRSITPELETVFVRQAEFFAQAHGFCEASLDRIFAGKEHRVEQDIFGGWSDFVQKSWLRRASGQTPSMAEIEDTLRWMRGNPDGGTHKTIGDAHISLQKGCFVMDQP